MKDSKMPQDFNLSQGMLASADIKVGKRTDNILHLSNNESFRRIFYGSRIKIPINHLKQLKTYFFERGLVKVRLIDAQVHAYERNHKERPWVDELVGPEEVTGDAMIREMERVGVDGAILVSPWTMYRYDASYAKSVYEKFPNKFRLVRPVDPNNPEVGEIILEWDKN